MEKRAPLFVLFLIFLGVALTLVSFTWGQYAVPLKSLFSLLGDRVMTWVSGGPLSYEGYTDAHYRVVTLIRMPRVLLAGGVGCALALAGCLFQALFRNPLVSPGLLGASNGAAFGAALALIFELNRSLVSTFALGFGLASVALVFLLSRPIPVGRTLGLVLCGLLVSTLFQAGLSFLKLAADPTDKLPTITYWLMGSLTGARWSDLLWLFPLLPPVAVVLFLLRRPLTALTLPEVECRALGVNVPLMRGVLLVCSTLLTAAAVSVSGVIGWVGLMVPHLARMLVGEDQEKVLVTSALLGWIFLLAVDDVARLALSRELPLGILTSLIGAPFYFFLLLRRGGWERD